MAFASNSWRQSCAFTPQHQRKFQGEFLAGPRQSVTSKVLTFFIQSCHTSTVTLTCVAGHIPSRTIDIQDGLSCDASTASYRDSLAIWSAQQSDGRPLGRRHDDGGVQANMLDGGRHMCPNAPGTVCRLLSLVEVVRCGW